MLVEEEIIMSLELKSIERESYKKRCIISWITIVCIVVCIMVSLPRLVYAADPQPDTSHDTDITNNLNDFLDLTSLTYYYAPLVQILQNGVFIRLCIDKFYSGGVTDTIIEDLQKLDFVKGLEGALQAIAMLIIMYHLILSIVKELERGEMTMESWLRILMAFVIPCVCIIECKRMIKGFATLGSWMQQIIFNNATMNFSGEDLIDEGSCVPVPTYSFTDGLGEYLGELQDYLWASIKGVLLFIPFCLLNFIIVLTILSGVLTNFVEICIRHLFLPLAIANISYEGVRSSGLRFIKKYLGCYIKIGCIMLIVSVVFYVYYELVSISGDSAFYKVMFFVLLQPATKQSLKMGSEIITEALGD